MSAAPAILELLGHLAIVRGRQYVREMGAVSIAIGVQESLCLKPHAINRPLEVPCNQGSGPLLLLKETYEAVRQA